MTHPFLQRHLGDILRARGLATSQQIDAAGVVDELALGEALLGQGVITSAQWAEALAERFNLSCLQLDGFTVAAELFRFIAVADCHQHTLLPYRRDGDVLEVVVADPREQTLAQQIEAQHGLRVRLLLSSRAEIEAALKRSEGETALLQDMAQDFRLLVVRQDEEGGERLVSLDSLDDSAAPVVRLVNTLLAAALTKRASDVHIETHELAIQVKYRIDGVLYPATEMLDKHHHSALVSRLKVMAELDIAERRVPQDGRFRLRFSGRDIDFRLSIMPGVFGEDVVIRILDKSSVTRDLRQLRLEGLGMAGEVMKKFRRAVREPYGMVLITGPTGSGKTTTLYAAISEINSGEEKIITIEDPVEYQLDGIVQIPVNEKKGLTFARGLRSILRHDPDKIMVGEIRDPETAAIAVQSALTGHLVFTTVHANNVFDVVGRFVHMGLDAYSFVSALNCVMAQRLVRLICPQCKQPAQVSAELLELSGLDPQQHAGQPWFEGAGCEHCHGTGYRGRAAITEFLDLTPQIRQLIIERRPLPELQQAALAEGLITLRQSALAKVF
ncbi:MAG: GspE/PulE family protein, partial [Hylemonella sp.]|nr:GspE/PulE family protein [Hylemonella sp.]